MGEQRRLSYRKQTRYKRSSSFVGRPWHPNKSTLSRNLCSIKCNGFDSAPALMGNTLQKYWSEATARLHSASPHFHRGWYLVFIRGRLLAETLEDPDWRSGASHCWEQNGGETFLFGNFENQTSTWNVFRLCGLSFFFFFKSQSCNLSNKKALTGHEEEIQEVAASRSYC